MEYIPNVIQAIPLEDFCICVYFTDGSIKQFDMKPLIERGGVFSQLSNSDFFNSRLTVMNSTAAWDIAGNWNERECIDIDPCTLYEAGIDIPDPLEKGRD